MPYKSLLFLLLPVLFFTVSLHAQQAGDYSLLSPLTNKPSLNKTCEVYIKPFALIDPVSGTLQVGLQKNINNRFALAIDYGPAFHVLSYAYKNSGREGYRYSKTYFEARYFTNQKPRWNMNNSRHYFSVRCFYFPQHYRLNNEFLTLDSVSYRYDYSDIKRTVWTFDLISGHEITGKRIVWKPYYGFGFRKISLQHHAFNLVPGYPSNPIDWDFSSHIERSNGTFYRPDFVLGLCIGYRL